MNIVINIHKSILNLIRSTAQDHYPNEIGGIFLGSYSHVGVEEAKIKEILVPEAFVSSTILFTRKAKGINRLIKERFYASNGNIIYLGEWHSHPFGLSEYSELDLRSIKAIAESRYVAILHPILCIMHHYNEEWRERFFIFFRGGLYKYEKL